MTTAPQLTDETIEAGLDRSSEERAWGTFVKHFCGLLFVLLLLTAVMNFVVNPIAHYPPHVLEPMVWNPRESKAHLLLTATLKPEALIFGSSRTWSFSPKRLAEITRLRSFNFGVDTARAEDYLVLLRYAVERAGVVPKLVVIGVDTEAFHPTTPLDPRLEQVWAFHGLVPENDRSWARLGSRLSSLVALQQTELSLRALRYEVSERTGVGPRRNAFYNQDVRDGDTSFIQNAAERATGHYDLNFKIRDNIAAYRERWKAYTHLGPERIRDLQLTLQYCQDRNIKVLLYLTPLHPRLEAALQDEDFAARRTDVVAMLKQLSESTGAPFMDLSEIQTFGGDPQEFWDGAHMTPENGRRLVNYFMEHTGYAVQ